MPAVTEMRTLECISNPVGGDLISSAMWEGIRMADLLKQAGVKPDTTEIVIRSADEFHTAIPIELAQDEHALLAYTMINARDGWGRGHTNRLRRAVPGQRFPGWDGRDPQSDCEGENIEQAFP